MIRVLLFLGIFSLGWCSSEPDQLYDDGMQAMRRRDYRTGGSLLLKAARLGHVKSMRRLSQIYERGIGTQADVDKARHWKELARKAYDEKQKAEEPGLSLKLPPSQTSSIKVARNLASQSEYYLEEGDWKQALSYADAALFVDYNPAILVFRLRALERLHPENFALVDQEYRLAIKNFFYPEILEMYGYFLMKMKDYRTAHSMFSKAAVEENKSPFWVYTGLCETAFLLGDPEASAWLEKARRLYPDHPDVKRLESLIGS